MRTLIPELGVQSEHDERDGGWNRLKTSERVVRKEESYEHETIGG